MDKREKTGKLLLTLSIGTDIFFYVCFFVGFALGLVGTEAGFYMLAIAFKYGWIICTGSILLKLAVIIINFSRDTSVKRKQLNIALLSMRTLLVMGGMIGFVYYIGKVMSSVG